MAALQEAKDAEIIDCQIWPDGLVALLGNFRFIQVTNFDEPQTRILADARKLI